MRAVEGIDATDRPRSHFSNEFYGDYGLVKSILQQNSAANWICYLLHMQMSHAAQLWRRGWLIVGRYIQLTQRFGSIKKTY